MNDNYLKFVKELKNKIPNKKEIVFCCIGTDKVIGDCIGPITGSLLKNKINNRFVYGDLDNNLTFNNINEKINEIHSKFYNPFIIAIDAALSNDNYIGQIFIQNGGICIGEGLNKEYNNIGNLGIKAVVGKDYNDNALNFKTLQNVSLKRIIFLSKIISDGIIDCIE